MPPKKAMEEYIKAFEMKTQFFSTYHPDAIEHALCQYLRNQQKIEPKVNENKYKVKFQLVTQDQGEVAQQVTDICVRILKVNDDMSCVEF